MVSSKDVARLAGVSQATVSRVLNNPDKVNKPTLDKVNDAIRQLNYRPNAAARSLISRKSGVIAVVSGPLDDQEQARFSNRSVQYIQQAGFVAELHIVDPAHQEESLSAIQTTKADGVLIGAVEMDEIAAIKLKKTGIPLVFCNMKPGAGSHFVSMDNIAAGRMAAEHILTLSHKVVAWLGGSSNDPHLYGRQRGFLDELYGKNISLAKSETGVDELDGVLSAIMARRDRPTAIVAATDDIALRAMDFLVDYGYSIPGDISLLGIGNSEISSMSFINLTTIGIPDEIDIHREAVERIVRLTEDGKSVAMDSLVVEPVLYKRKTTKKKDI